MLRDTFVILAMVSILSVNVRADGGDEVDPALRPQGLVAYNIATGEKKTVQALVEYGSATPAFCAGGGKLLFSAIQDGWTTTDPAEWYADYFAVQRTYVYDLATDTRVLQGDGLIYSGSILGESAIFGLEDAAGYPTNMYWRRNGESTLLGARGACVDQTINTAVWLDDATTPTVKMLNKTSGVVSAVAAIDGSWLTGLGLSGDTTIVYSMYGEPSNILHTLDLTTGIDSIGSTCDQATLKVGNNSAVFFRDQDVIWRNVATGVETNVSDIDPAEAYQISLDVSPDGTKVTWTQFPRNDPFSGSVLLFDTLTGLTTTVATGLNAGSLYSVADNDWIIYDPLVPVPEPGTVGMLVATLAAVVIARRKTKRGKHGNEGCSR